MEQIELFSTQAQQNDMIRLTVKAGHHVFPEGMEVVGRYLPGLNWYRCYSLTGEPLGDIHAMDLEKV